MSNAIYPALPGLAWSVTKKPQWSTKIQRAVNGRELRAAFYLAPIYEVSLTYNLLRGGSWGELQTLHGFFNQRRGSFDSFLWSDPNDRQATNQAFAVGDGVTKTFQLARTLGGDTEPVSNPQGAPVVKVNGTVTPVTVANGLVTFATAPATGAVLTWDGLYYHRCRFGDDSLEFENFAKDLFNAKKVKFQACLGNKI